VLKNTISFVKPTFPAMIREEIPLQLYASARPGYDHGRNRQVSADILSEWISRAQKIGVRSILCLLDERHLCLYDSMSGGLLDAFRAKGFEVGHVHVIDHQWPSLSDEELQRVAFLFEGLPKPVLIHCSAGLDRTGSAVEHIKRHPMPSRIIQ
jgi:hypothetical protein